jgi:hypothetical protein
VHLLSQGLLDLDQNVDATFAIIYIDNSILFFIFAVELFLQLNGAFLRISFEVVDGSVLVKNEGPFLLHSKLIFLQKSALEHVLAIFYLQKMRFFRLIGLAYDC